MLAQSDNSSASKIGVFATADIMVIGEKIGPLPPPILPGLGLENEVSLQNSCTLIITSSRKMILKKKTLPWILASLWSCMFHKPVHMDGHTQFFLFQVLQNRWMMCISRTSDALAANLAPIQFGTDVYFKVVKAIPTGNELLVYSCADFPISPEVKLPQSSIFKTDSKFCFSVST